MEVNVAGEEGKAGIAPDVLGAFIERSPVRVSGLMTVPPFSRGSGGESSVFRGAARARRRRTHLTWLSMGTSQDFAVAVEEAATIVGVGIAPVWGMMQGKGAVAKRRTRMALRDTLASDAVYFGLAEARDGTKRRRSPPA